MDKTCWSVLVAGIVEGDVGGTGARAADGVGRGVCFCRPLGCLRACVLAPLTGFHLIGVVLEHGGVGGCWLYWEGSI